jgi:hypothetical protein
MSASAAKLAANRANASYSTGPADTSRTRFNGLTHGLTSKQTVIRGEDQQEYDIFSSNLGKQLAPASPIENVLADRVIAAAWRLKRFTRVESSFFTNRVDAFLEVNPDGDPDAALANLFTDPSEMARMRLFLRYQTSVQREYDKATSEFQKAKSERLSHKLEDTFRDMLFEKAVPHSADRPTPVGFGSQWTKTEGPESEIRASAESPKPIAKAAGAA